MRLPLRLRVSLAFAVSVAAVLAGLGVFVYLRLGAELQHEVDLDLRSRAGLITAAAADRGVVTLDAHGSLIDQDEAFAQVLTADGTIVEASSAVRRSPMVPRRIVAHITAPTFVTRRVEGVGDPARLLATPMRSDGHPLVVVVGANLGDRDEALHRLLLLLALGLPAAVLLASGIGWLVAGTGLRPVEQLRREAAAASATASGATVTVPPTGDELARLARTLNDLLQRQRDALDAEHRFLDEASHDLRTPLAVLKAELDLAVARPRSRGELEQTVRAAARETDQLVRLAEDLLVLARSRHGPLTLRREPVPLRQFCAECVAPFETGGQPIAVTADDVVVAVDPLRLRQAVRNLLDNAVRHGGGRDVSLIARARADGAAVLTVTDAGSGLPSSSSGRLRRPSAPADGLGLAIVAAVAEAHGGAVEAGRSASGGASVTIVLPPAM
jgi:two-component system OmpR family sensor kinase